MSNYGYPGQSYGPPPPQQYYNAYVILDMRHHDSGYPVQISRELVTNAPAVLHMDTITPRKRLSTATAKEHPLRNPTATTR